MKVLLLTDGIYPFLMGGMQKHSYYLGKFLSQSGVDVTLVHCHDGKQRSVEKEMPEFAGFDHGHISFRSFSFPALKNYPGHYVRENELYSERIYFNLKDELRQFDLIYCQGFTGWKFIREARKGNLQAPVASNLHGYEMFQKAPSVKVKVEHLMLRGIAKEISIKSDFVFSFGGKITEIIKSLGVKDEQIYECPIGIESSWLSDKANPVEDGMKKFVFIGRNERRKGITELSRALKELIKEGVTGFEFHFIGDIAEKEWIESPSIRYHGKIIDEELIRKILADSDILCVPSYSEGMPTVIMEAMASGLAIIGTNVGAIQQQIQNNGWIIPDSKVSTIKNAIRTAIRTPDDELLQLKENSLKRVKEHYLWEKVIQHKISCFEEMIR